MVLTHADAAFQLTEFLFTTVLALLVARFIRAVPSIVLEIIFGIVVGAGIFSLNMGSFGIDVLSSIGLFAIFFEVGLDFDLTAPELTSATPARSAAVGVAASFVLVALATLALGYPLEAAVLVGLATVSTSVSVSVYSFRTLGPLSHFEAKVAVIAGLFDDMLGLVVIAITASLLSHSLASLVSLAVSLVVVFVSYILKRRLSDRSFELGRLLRYVMVAALIAVMVFLWRSFGLTLAIAGFVGGAFSGPMLTEADQRFLIRLSGFLGPLFLVSIGLLVKLKGGLTVAEVLGILVLSTVLIAAKWANALAIGAQVKDRVLYWFSMVPRAEVAGIGLLLIEPKISSSLELQAVLAVVVTSLVAPFVITHRARRINQAEGS